VTIDAGAIVGAAALVVDVPGLVVEVWVEPKLDEPELLDAEVTAEGAVLAELLPLADGEALPEALVLPPRGVTAAWALVLPT